MKKNYLALIALIMVSFTNAQQKSTGIMPLGSYMTSKIDLNQTNSQVTVTLTAPSTSWFCIGFNASSMGNAPDCIVMRSATNLSDSKISGYAAPSSDATQNWTMTSNTVSGTTRTVIATRAFNSGDAADYIFNYASNSINLIWAVGNGSFTVTQHIDSNHRGATTGTFTVLGVDDFAALNKVIVYPNPSNGVFTVAKNTSTPISKIRIFDSNAKLLKEITNIFDNQDISVNLSELTKGLYFMEISNEEDKTVKKIQIN